MEKISNKVIKRIREIHKEFMTGSGRLNSAYEIELAKIKKDNDLSDSQIYEIFKLND